MAVHLKIIMKCLCPRARDDGRPHHEVHLRAGGQRDRLERPIILAWRARAPVLSTSISLFFLIEAMQA